MPDLKLYAEAYKRGLLQGKQLAGYQELMRRGLHIPTLPPTGTPLDASPRPTPPHMGKAVLSHLRERTLHNIGRTDERSKFSQKKPGTEGIYQGPAEMQYGEVDPPGTKGIKAASKKLGKYADETLYVVGSRKDVYTPMADDVAFNMGAVKTDLVEGHRTPHAAYFKTRKEAEAYKQQIGTSADFISAETRSLPDTPYVPMEPDPRNLPGDYIPTHLLKEKQTKWTQPGKGQKPYGFKKEKMTTNLKSNEISEVARSLDYGDYRYAEQYLKEKNIKYIDAFNVSDIRLKGEINKEGVKMGQGWYGRDESVYFFADPDDIFNAIPYLAMKTEGTTGGDVLVTHFKIPIEDLKHVEWDGFFASQFDTYSAFSIKKNIPRRKVFGTKVYKIPDAETYKRIDPRQKVK